MIPGLPAGRAGRTWLVERLATGERAADLLDHKLRVLQREQQSFRLRAERTAATWAQSVAEAEKWLVRAALLGGRRALQNAVPAGQATVDVRWTLVMGVRHPGDTVVTGGQPAAGAATPSNSALVRAVWAYRAALDAAAQHAVVDAAVRRIDIEVATTRRRLRAIRDRRVPQLREGLAALELELEELEHGDGVRLRWAAAHPATAVLEET